ncbi:10797_t:CDS:2 [Funneliformis mosseae]|uniref:10797_t:CDS:1 n=1 Tax=Funneliformis mosseae TaxID=27381 RepID=A0A9N9GEA7_FUNMO|nr:10797_t:CDS:2 [Funneliformis mosseae]
MKDHIKEKLDTNELCVSMLQKSEEKGLTFDDLWNKKINSTMKEWKQNKNTQKVYKDLYKSSNSEDEKVNTYITLIIKFIFTAEKERMASNSIWVQSVIETIFNEKYLSTKIDSKVIEI